MEWDDRFGAEEKPALADIEAYTATPLWNDLVAFLGESYEVEPEMAYSSCSGQPGWNVKFKKAGRALCTLYPMDGFFIALVVIGLKEHDETLGLIPECSPYTRELFERTKVFMGQRWLMINVTDEGILQDVKRLIQVRRKVKRSTGA